MFSKKTFKRKGNGVGEVKGGAEEIVSGAGSVVTGAVTTVTDAVTQLVNPKQAECEKKWDKYSQSIRPSSQEDLNKMKADFIASCLATK